MKSNIGHLDHAAGIAGLLKAILALKYREIPSTLHFGIPNRKITFENSPIYVNDRHIPWETGDFPRRCGVSAFGLSGTNCHVILEEAPVRPSKSKAELKWRILAISAKSENSLLELVKSYQAYLEQEPSVHGESLCYTANTGRGHYTFRLAILFEDLGDLKEKLDRLAGCGFCNITDSRILYGNHTMIPENKKRQEPGDLTEAEKKRWDFLAAESLQQIRNSTNTVTENKLAELGLYYIKGAEIKWEELYQRSQVELVHLPGYPFERIRCWLEIPEVVREKGRESLLYNQMEETRSPSHG